MLKALTRYRTLSPGSRREKVELVAAGPRRRLRRLGRRVVAGAWWLAKSVGGYALAAAVVPPLVSLLLPTYRLGAAYTYSPYFDAVLRTASHTWFFILLSIVWVLPVLCVLLALRKRLETATLRGLAAFLLCAPALLTAMVGGGSAMLVHVITNVTYAVVLLPVRRR
ncbi:hypothetical protein ACH4OW_15565 [Streptomyces sp. NPDC017056]|uniref:hypothetical protein n=1 Tax=Streptomyces sp. NPDC017056 TaxID=3364973 RepID=UPI0037AECDAD